MLFSGNYLNSNITEKIWFGGKPVNEYENIRYSLNKKPLKCVLWLEADQLMYMIGKNKYQYLIDQIGNLHG